MRWVLDTATMVAAVRSDAGASRQLLVASLERRAVMLVSTPLLLEYEAVITRPDHLDAAEVSEADVGVLLDAIAAVAEPVRLAFHWRPLLKDPDDDMVLETAINGAAEAIVTFNVRDFSAGVGGFGVRILTPGQALRSLEDRQ